MKSKKFYYELFLPGDPITPKETKIQEKKRQAITAFDAVAYGVLIISILQGCALIAAGIK